MTKTYSVCITCFNNVGTIEQSFKSILSQLDDRFEVVVVDNYSTDGSFELLSKLARSYKMKLIRRKSSRGQGRQIAFENSCGDYVIANLDADELYLPILEDVLNCYHKKCEQNILLVTAGIGKDIRGVQNVTIGPHTLIKELGGWRNLQWGEDWDLWSRSAKRGRYAWTSARLVERINLHPERGKLLKRIRMRYTRYRDFLRVGRNVFQEEEQIGIMQRALYGLAKLSLPFQDSYKDNFNQTFNCFSKDCYVDFTGELRQLLDHESAK